MSDDCEIEMKTRSVMGEATNILWAGRPLPDGSIEPGYSWNPWIGCTKVSAGCLNCYAERQNNFYQWNPEGWGKGVPRKLTSDSNWQKPIQWAKQAVKDGVTRRVFCASLADVFDDEVPVSWREKLWHLITTTRNIGGLEWLLLTKRPEYIKWLFPQTWLDYPPSNIRMGITVENQEMAHKRILEFLEVWHSKNFISVEPMLSGVDIHHYLPTHIPCPGFSEKHKLVVRDVNWVICGCESGSNARPMNIEWARSLRDQCVEAGTPFFLKQIVIDGKLVREPELDGQKWLEFPEAELSK